MLIEKVLQLFRHARARQASEHDCASARSALRITEIEGGFPHSEIRGSKVVRTSPRLIAAYHVLHRLSAPRHPPNALLALDRSHYRKPLGGASRSGDPEPPSAFDRKTICFKHIREPCGQAQPTLVARPKRLAARWSDRTCFLFTMTDSTRRNSVPRKLFKGRRQSAVGLGQSDGSDIF